MSPFLKRAALLAVAAMALGACEFDLGIPEEAVAPGSTVPVTNENGDTCAVPLPPKELQTEAVGDPDDEDGAEVIGFVISDLFIEEEPELAFDTFTDADGIFKDEVTAPEVPGLHLVFAECFTDEAPVLEATAINEDGGYGDFLRVAHTPLTIALSDDEVAPGDTVTATFPACQDDNDLGISAPDLDADAAAEPTQEDIYTDYPDLEVFLDGELVDTVEGTERYPTADIEVPVTVEDEGEHEISGVCTYQTFDIDQESFEDFIDVIDEPTEPVGLQAAAIDYPFTQDEPFEFTYDEDTSTAAATLVVVAPAVEPTTGAQPVQAQPNFTG